MKVLTLIAVLFMMMLVPATASAEEFTQEDARDMAFGQLDEEKQKAVLAMLQKMLDTGLEEAEELIREEGSFVPFAYVMNPQGEGQFLRLSDDQEMRAEVAAHAVQRAIVTNAFQGNLVASSVFLTMEAPRDGMEELEGDLEEELGDDRELDDVRFLMVEQQHLGGLGLVSAVPYWQDGGEWHFGEPQQQQVDPELHNVVQRTFQEAAEEQGEVQE